MSASLPDELNTFYARFESTSPAVEVQKAQEDHCPPVISRADVCRTLKRINTRKAPGPDGIPGRALKGCVLSPLLYSLFTHDCVATHSSNTIVPNLLDDTTVPIGLITGNDEDGLQRGQRRRQREEHAPLSINGTTVERVRVNSFRFLGVHISEDLTWTHHTDFITKSARQRLFFLRRLSGGSTWTPGSPLQLLQVHHREDPDWLHHRLVTGQTKSGSQAHHEKKNIKDRYVARIGVTGAPPWSQAWGWGSQARRLVAGSLPTGPGRAQPGNGDVWARLPVGSPPAGRSMRGRCNVVWVGSRQWQGPRRPNPWTKTLAIGTWNVTSLGGKEPELCVREVERYRLEIVGLTSTHSLGLGSGTQLLERAGPSTTLELPRVSGGELVWACL
ncbi:hypothetical protein L3Q82_004219 [Scortum barcoo]|uniref:Uncharacterized protein n=1 Tax=Scortum barcoo TaxID=214431 RepID=A0ACB8VJJ2_9TELE|nr:hypothetical protein L3Q82_004219 [Scortum barcoo]